MRHILLTTELKQFLVDSISQQWQSIHPPPDMNNAAYNLAFRALQKNYGDAFEHVFEMMQDNPIQGKFIHLEANLIVLVKELKQTIILEWNANNALPVPLRHNTEVPLVVSKEFDEWKQFQIVQDKMNQWQSNKNVLIDQVNAVLHSFQDSTNLVKYWPEFEPFFHGWIRTGITNFPQKR